MIHSKKMWHMLFLALTFIIILCCDTLSDTIKITPGESAASALQNALSVAKPGDTIVISPGQYHPMDRLSPSISGLPGNPIVIKAKTRGDTIFSAMGNKYGFLLENKQYIEIDGIVLEGYSGCGVKLITSSNCRISYVTVRNSGSHNISVVAGQNVTIDNCVSQMSNACGIALIEDSNGTLGYNHTVNGCWATKNKNQGILVTSTGSHIFENICDENGSRVPLDHGIYCIGNTNQIIGNICLNNPFGSGIRVGNWNHVIGSNVCKNNGRSGIVVAGTNDTHDLIIEANRLKANTLDGIEINSSTYQPHDLIIKENVIFDNGRSNLQIKHDIGTVTVQGNLFATSNILISVANEPSRVHLSLNRYFGEVCRFFLGEITMEGNAFFSRMENTAQCEPATVFEQLIQ